MDDRIHFCQSCDTRHEGEALWVDWSQQNLHLGVPDWRTQERIATQLQNRLCHMLFKETDQPRILLASFEEAVCLAGDTARDVLDRLRHFEVKHGRHRGRPRRYLTDAERKRASRNKTAVGKG